jgi:hypothetical protein
MFHPIEMVEWLETHTGRLLREPQSEALLWSELGQARVPHSLSNPLSQPDLLIVLTTHARPDACARILDTLPTLIESAGRPIRPHLLVLHDVSSRDYDAPRFVAAQRWSHPLTWLDTARHFGKVGYWKLYQAAFFAARHLRPKHVLFLQDDVQYERTLLRDAYALWQATADDPLRRVLYLFSSDDDEPDGRWIRHRRSRLAHAPLSLTQWFDLQGYFVDLAFFELLQFAIVPIHPNRFRRRPNLSSGVGAQLTRRLYGRANIYQATPPLLLHGAHPSVMNPEARTARALDNLRWARELRFSPIC